MQQMCKHSEIKSDRNFLTFVEQPLSWERRICFVDTGKLKVYKQEWLSKRSGGRFNQGIYSDILRLLWELYDAIRQLEETSVYSH
jgi:hypothetical protein